MADMGEWSLGFVEKNCLLDEWEKVFFFFLSMSVRLTDVAFLHVSIVNDQSFNMLDGYRMQTSSSLDKTQCSVDASVFTSRVPGVLCRTSLLMYYSSPRSPNGLELFKVLYLVYSKKENQPLAMHLILNKHFLFVQSTTGAARPLSRPITDSPDHSP